MIVLVNHGRFLRPRSLVPTCILYGALNLRRRLRPRRTRSSADAISVGGSVRHTKYTSGRESEAEGNVRGLRGRSSGSERTSFTGTNACTSFRGEQSPA